MRLYVTLLITATLALPAFAAAKPKKEAAPIKDHSDVCHPGGELGTVLCETAESFADCKAVEGKGKLLVEGDAPGKATTVVHCEQAG